MSNFSSSLPGSWRVLEATLPNGQPAYTGQIHIRPQGEIFDLEWDISVGRYVGVGLGCADHFFVSCGEQRAGLGLALLHAQPDGGVRVQWCTPDLQGAVGGGVFLSPFAGNWADEHRVRYELPNGALYGEWQVTITPVDSIFRVTWQKGPTVHFVGLGLPTPTGLAVGWYPDQVQIAFLDYTLDAADPNRLLATWALGGFSTLGTEVLQRA